MYRIFNHASRSRCAFVLLNHLLINPYPANVENMVSS